VPAARLKEVQGSKFLDAIHPDFMRDMVPVTVADASTGTGELSVEPLTGLHTFTPGLVDAVQRYLGGNGLLQWQLLFLA
jgi:hypothetical protein